MLDNERIQQRLAQKAVGILSEQLNTRVSVGHVRFQLFNKISLYNVVIEDQQQDTLLVADELNATFQLLPFFQNQFIFMRVRLNDVSIALKNDVEQGNNFDFFIQALSGGNNDILLKLKIVQLVNVNVQYTSNRKPPSKNGFDANNIDIRNLNARLSFNLYSRDSLSLDIRRLNFEEKSGLKVNNMVARIGLANKNLSIEDFILSLPKTTININPVHFKFTDSGSFADSVNFKIGLKPSTICLGDFSAFVPALKTISSPINITGVFNGPLANLTCPSLEINYGKNTRLIGNFNFRGLPNIDSTYVFARIADFHTIKPDVEDLIADIKNMPFQLPEIVRALDKLNFKGELDGNFATGLAANGNIRTNLGDIIMQMSLERKRPEENSFAFHGEVKTDDLQLGALLERKEIGNITFNLRVNGEKGAQRPLALNLEGAIDNFFYNDYEYNNIVLNGFYENNKFNGAIDLNDKNGIVHLDGLLDFSESLPYFDFTANVMNLKPGNMNLATKYPDMVYSFNMNINVRGNNLDNIMGNIFMSDVSLVNGDRELHLQKFEAISEYSEDLNSIVIASDFVNGIIEGRYTISTFVASARYVASQYMPALNTGRNAVAEVTDNNFDFDLKIHDLDTISNLLGIKWRTSSDINFYGYYDDQTRKFRIRGVIPFINNNKTDLSDIIFLCENPGDDLRVALDFKFEREKSPTIFDISIRASAKNDTLLTAFQWNNNDEANHYKGDVYALTGFARNEQRELKTITNILPTNMIFSGLPWYISESIIMTEPSKYTIHNFRVGYADQFINIDGTVSAKEEDQLVLQVGNIDLNYLKLFVNMDVIDLGGIVSGSAMVNSVLNQPIIQADLKAKDFSFNNSRWGDLALKSVWENTQERLKMDINVFDAGKQIIDLSGYVYPKRNIELDLLIKASDLPLEFLQPFLATVMQNITGTASSSQLRMMGPLVKPLFQGDAYVKNANFNIDFLKTSFSFSDTIHITPTSFSFRNITIYDPEKNTGRLTGTIEHDSYQNMRFNISGNFNNILAMNTQPGDNENFYGRAYGTGNLSIRGNQQTITFDIGARTEANTRVVIPFSSYMTAAENNFITFIERPKVEAGQTEPVRRRAWAARTQTAGANIRMNLQLEATPDAEIQLLIDPNGGDMIRATGNGNIRVVYDGIDGMMLYGSYTLVSGSYTFTLQNAFRRDFRIKEGSTITWSGSPYQAQININAYLPVRASLLDLFDETQLRDMQIGNSNVNVNCLLTLTGELTSPNILFNIELPGSSDELQRRVRSIINTDDMMTRQMLYLLAMNRFYRPDFMRNNPVAQGSGSELSSLVSSTLSAQLSNWISQINENITLGVNYQHTGSADGQTQGTEVEIRGGAAMLDNRLFITGNLGYRDDIMSTNNFIGDFEVEYKLGKARRFRLRAYSRSNDKYYQQNTTTQGVGIGYREEFDNFGDLVKGYWNRLFRRNRTNAEAVKEEVEE